MSSYQYFHTIPLLLAYEIILIQMKVIVNSFFEKYFRYLRLASNRLLYEHIIVFYQNLNYRGMGVTMFIHPTLWCLLFGCLLTRWTLILYPAMVSQPQFANNFGIPPIIQDLFTQPYCSLNTTGMSHLIVFYRAT